MSIVHDQKRWVSLRSTHPTSMHSGMGSQIIEPASLREQMKSMLELAVSNYKK